MNFLSFVAVLTMAVIPVGDDGHAQNHDWYKNLKTRRGGSCCNGDVAHGDCRVVRARPRPDGSWEAQLPGRLGGWWVVPPEAILPDELNQQPLHAHICERDYNIYCFLKPGSGS